MPHLLCKWTEPIWFGIDYCPVPNPLSVTSFTDWLGALLSAADNLSLICFTIWNIWKVRNEKVHNEKQRNPMAVTILAKSQCFEFLRGTIKAIGDTRPVPRANPIAKRWRPPRESCHKVNCDAQFDRASGKGTVSAICRNNNGEVLTGDTLRIFATSSLVAETLRVRFALQLASNLKIDEVVIESDNVSVVEACRGNITRLHLASILSDIQALQATFRWCGFMWTAREGNSVAHQLAQLASSNSLPPNWLFHPPDALRHVIMEDRRGIILGAG